MKKETIASSKYSTTQVLGKANPETQEEFLERYNELQDMKGTKDRIRFVDGVHPLDNLQPANSWFKKGYNYTLESNAGHSPININGNYNIEDHKVVIESLSG